MRRYRAASFFTNQFAPEVSMGLQTTEEAYDITDRVQKIDPVEAANLKLNERVTLMISDATTIEHLEAISSQVDLTSEQQELLEAKKLEINGSK